MPILIHALAMRKQGGGSRHLQGFVSALGELDKENQYFLYLDERFPFDSPYPNIQVRRVKVKSQIQRLWFDQIILSKIVKEQGVDLILSLLVFGSFSPPCPQIVFQRNSIFFCREWLSQVPPFSTLGIRVKMRRHLAYLTMRASRVIVVPSLSMREMIRSFYPNIPEERFAVTPHAFELTSFVNEHPLDPVITAQVHSVPHEVPKLLYVSHLEPHKGFDVLFHALKILAGRGLDFRLFTTMDPRDGRAEFERLWGFVRTSGLEARVINLGRVPEDQVHHLYRTADIFVFPSLCESFGFPMKEALAMGLPIVAAGTGINREICGLAAVYYPPRDPDAMADAIQGLIESPERRSILSQAALEHFAQTTMDWKTYAARVIELMQNVIQRSGVADGI